MSRMLPLSIVLLLALAAVPAAEAGPIIYFDTYRSLNIDGTLFETTATGSWYASGGDGPTRLQNSTIGELRIDPGGHPYELTWASAGLFANRFQAANLSTSLMTSFLLDSPYTANLDAFASARNDGYAEGFLFDDNTQTMLAQIIVDEGTARLRYDGVLEPGMYSYYLFAQLNTPGGASDHQAQFGGDLELTPFTPVPEPGTMTLVGLGLAAAWRARRRSGSA
jgi:hypothetical protein